MAHRGDLEVVGDASGAVISRLKDEEAIHLDGDALRWLCAVAGPLILTSEPPPKGTSDAPEKVDEQIPGQTTIDDVLDESTV